MLIINADDWGRSRAETDTTLECVRRGSVTSLSAMVFMQDSQRGAELAREHHIAVGLHINLSQPFDGEGCSAALVEAHRRVVGYMKAKRGALLLYNPWLRAQFQHTFREQLAEFQRLYGTAPTHFDGHQHRHLCANMLVDKVVPPGSKVRRSFTFWRGQKSFINRAFRRWIDRRLASSYRITDGFFALSQNLGESQLARVLEYSITHTAELMTHPVIPRERDLLLSPLLQDRLQRLQLGSYADL